MKDILDPTYGQEVPSFDWWGPILPANRIPDILNVIDCAISSPVQSTLNLWEPLSNPDGLSIAYHYMKENI